jgi:hypothetical protein
MARLKQQYLSDEMKPVKIQEIVDAAEEYEGVRDSRMELTKQEVALQTKLLEVMKKNKLKFYNLGDGRIVEIIFESTEKVKVISEKSSTKRRKNGNSPPTEEPTGTPDSARVTGPLEADSKDDFIRLVVGEIIEAHNQSISWWEKLPEEKRRELFDKRLLKRPQRES